MDENAEFIRGAAFADLGFLDERGRPSIRRVFCTWHRGIGGHLISTNTSSSHVRRLMRDGAACLYFANEARFEGVCLTGRAMVRTDRAHREMLWHDGDVKYYPGGVDDEDYCVVEFLADGARYYRLGDIGELTGGQIAEWDASAEYECCGG